MYKSSPFTPLVRFVIPVFMLLGFVVSYFVMGEQDTPDSQQLRKGIVFIFIWTAFLFVQMMKNLRSIETTENGIVYTENKEVKTIEYKHIKWVAKMDIYNPLFYTIKYFDPLEKTYKKISYMPFQQRTDVGEDALTRFLKKKLIELNPDYEKNGAPGMLRNVLILIALALPFTLAFLYYVFIQ